MKIPLAQFLFVTEIPTPLRFSQRIDTTIVDIEDKVYAHLVPT